MMVKAYFGDCGQCQYLNMDMEGVFDLSPDHDGSVLGFSNLLPPKISCDCMDKFPILGRACPNFSEGCPPSSLFFDEQIVDIAGLIRSRKFATYWRCWVAMMDAAKESREETHRRNDQ